MIRIIIFIVLIQMLQSCKSEIPSSNNDITVTQDAKKDSINVAKAKIDFHQIFKNNLGYKSDGFDFPIGKPDAKGYYNAQKFQENNHLGDDWNGVGGGNSDLGDPIYSAANGYISEVKDYEGGWGNVVRIIHLHDDTLYQTVYAHCDTVLVAERQFIKKGEQIATIGNCNGHYLAHLHLEIRDDIDMDIGPGYSTETTGYLDPTDFINKNRH